jgi:ribose-phosphate pyrophosphokinase
MIILGGSASTSLADKVAKHLGQQPGKIEIKRFPDGDKYVRILDEVRDQDTVVIQSLYHKPEQKIYADQNIFELLLIVNTLHDLGARSIRVVAPYMAYARQDSRFFPGEAISSQIIARLLEDMGTTEFLTVDCHLHRLGDVSKIFNIPAQNLSAMPALGKYARKNLKTKNPIIIGPDEEADQWAGTVAKELQAEHTVFTKQRIRKEGETASKVQITPSSKVDLKGRDVVFADDIISTGGTLAEAAKICKKMGARKIYVLCTHPVLADGALKRVKAAGALKVIGTDTIPSPVSIVSVAPVIAAALRND